MASSTELATITKFLPGFFLDVVHSGVDYQGGVLPLHVSLFPPLRASYHRSYGNHLRDAVNPQVPFDITVGEPDMFGPKFDVPVMKIEDSPELRRIHEELVKVVAILMHDASYRQPYSPHISLGGRTLETGSTIHVAGFAIIEKSSGSPWHVVDKVGLKGESIDG
jgi:hypothetical protein